MRDAITSPPATFMQSRFPNRMPARHYPCLRDLAIHAMLLYLLSWRHSLKKISLNYANPKSRIYESLELILIENFSWFLLSCFARHQSDIRFSNCFEYRYPLTCMKGVLHVNVERCCHSFKSNVVHSLEVVLNPVAVTRLISRNISYGIFILIIQRRRRRKTRIVLQRVDKC